MNVTAQFVRLMDTEFSLGTPGQDIFIGGVPKRAPDRCWWVTSGGGSVEQKLRTGETFKNYVADVYYRSDSDRDVYEKLQAFEEQINSAGCLQLDGYNTIDLEAILFPTDQDLDSEDRTVGLLQVRIRTYKE